MDRPAPALRFPELEACWRELRSAGEEARKLADDLSDRELWWRPAPDRWSIGECLDHLVRTDEAYLASLDRAIGEGRRRGLEAEEPSGPTLVGRWLPRLLEPPPRPAVPAPGEIRPRRPGAGPDAEDGGSKAPPDPLDAFLGLRPRLLRRLQAADGLDLGRIRLSSPFFAWMRFDLGSAFRIVAAHERRHLWQARRVREDEAFPGA